MTTTALLLNMFNVMMAKPNATNNGDNSRSSPNGTHKRIVSLLHLSVHFLSRSSSVGTALTTFHGCQCHRRRGERQRKGRRDGRRQGKFVLSLAAISIKRMEPELMANFSALKQLDFSQNFLGFLLFGIFDGLDEVQALLGLASIQWVNLEWFSAEAEQIEIEANGN